MHAFSFSFKILGSSYVMLERSLYMILPPWSWEGISERRPHLSLVLTHAAPTSSPPTANFEETTCIIRPCCFGFFFGTADLWKLEQKRLQSLPDPHFPIFVITGCQYGICHGWDMCCCGLSPELSRKRLVCVPAKPRTSCVASINHPRALSVGSRFCKQVTISTLSTSQGCRENAFHSFIP